MKVGGAESGGGGPRGNCICSRVDPLWIGIANNLYTVEPP